MSTDIHQIPSATPDFRTELAEHLSELVPEAITDGKVDIEKLKELLDGDVADSSERFGLFWPGKKRAMRAAQEPTTATLKPDFGNSKDWDSTQNVFIEGDNLEVLKVLQKHYHGKIKTIYIDPPYNTGKDFVYPDNFKEGLSTYLEWTKQVNEEGRKLSSNSESEGRYHSNWLNMMYPRLKLSRNLLADDGVIFVSIDDHEVANLRHMLDSVFGEANFIENYIWESNFRPDNSSRIERENAQHILCYARKKSALRSLVGAQKATEGLPSLTKSSMKESTLCLQPEWVDFLLKDGHYSAGDLGAGYRLETDVTVVNGVAQSPFRLKGRVIWSQDYLENQIKLGTKIVIKGASFVPYSRKVATSELAPTTLLPRQSVGDVLAGNAEIRSLFNRPVFNHPKPTSLLRYLIRSVMAHDKEGIVLDYFAGSASTAHAVMQLNAEDGGNRQHIQIQLPEPTLENSEPHNAGYVTIAEVARERMHRAGEKIRADYAHELSERDTPLDIGYRAYKLSDTNFTKWQVSSDEPVNELEQHLLALRDSANGYASADDLLIELLLKQGHSLNEKITPVEIAGLELRSVNDGLVLAYLNEHVKPKIDQIRAIAEAKPERFIVLEDAFQGDDELKTNLVQICKTNNIELWTA